MTFMIYWKIAFTVFILHQSHESLVLIDTWDNGVHRFKTFLTIAQPSFRIRFFMNH